MPRFSFAACGLALLGPAAFMAQLRAQEQWRVLALGSTAIEDAGGGQLAVYGRSQTEPSVTAKLRYHLEKKLTERAATNTVLVLTPFSGSSPQGAVYWTHYRTLRPGLHALAAGILTVPGASDAFVAVSSHVPPKLEIDLYQVDLKAPLRPAVPDFDGDRQEEWLPESKPLASQSFEITAKLGCLASRINLLPKQGGVILVATGTPAGCPGLAVEYDLNSRTWSRVEFRPAGTNPRRN